MGELLTFSPLRAKWMQHLRAAQDFMQGVHLGPTRRLVLEAFAMGNWAASAGDLTEVHRNAMIEAYLRTWALENPGDVADLLLEVWG